jgi:hypothetical protein
VGIEALAKTPGTRVETSSFQENEGDESEEKSMVPVSSTLPGKNSSGVIALKGFCVVQLGASYLGFLGWPSGGGG